MKLKMMMMQDDYEEHKKRIEEKLKNDPSLQDEIDDYVQRLGEIFEGHVLLEVMFTPYSNEDIINERIFDLKNEKEKDVDDDETLTLLNLKELIQDEDDDMNLYIDPLYLNEGLNSIKDILVTSVDENLIIVPRTKKKIGYEKK